MYIKSLGHGSFCSTGYISREIGGRSTRQLGASLPFMVSQENRVTVTTCDPHFFLKGYNLQYPPVALPSPGRNGSGGYFRASVPPTGD